MFAASKTAAAAAGTPPPSTDPQFNYVTMLLHGDGTNGAQNNTFVDSSTNNFTITRNGTPTQGSFSPYGTLWSNYFPTSTNYLKFTGTNAAFQFGTGDWTVECWVCPQTIKADQYIWDFRPTSNGAYPALDMSSTSFKYVANAAVQITGTTAPKVGTWYHVAVCRSGTSTKLFVNGVQEGSTYSDSTNYTVAADRPYIGIDSFSGSSFPFNGSISNVRIVKGTALYTSNFTPSTTPLTAVSGTSLLTCQSNRFRDNSSNNFAITVTGTPSVQRFSPFDPAAEYSTSVIGGSGQFSSNTSYLTAASNAAFAFPGEFTVEGWFYWTTIPSAGQITGVLASGGFNITYNTTLQFNLFGTGAIASATFTPVVGRWYHIAMTRNASNLCTVWIDGVSSATGTSSASFVQGAWSLYGGSNNGGAGYVSNLRVVKGTAVYTAAFTPPTAPLTAITNTSLLLNTVNAGIFDNAMMNDLVTVGNAQVSTAVKKYGTGSIVFDLLDDCVIAPSSPNFQYGTGDFTVEFWLYFASLPSLTAIIFDQRTAATQVVPTLYYDTNNLYYFTNGANRISGTFTTTGAWVHVAVCRSSGSTKLFVNGVQLGSTYTDTNNYITSPVYIGARWDLQGELNGYIDDFRITKGYARYTANFTPPTAALPNN